MIKQISTLLTLLLMGPSFAHATPECKISEFGNLEYDEQAHDLVFRSNDLIKARLGVVFGVGHKFTGLPEKSNIQFIITFAQSEAGPYNETISIIELPSNYEVSYFKFSESKEIRQGYWRFAYAANGIEICSKLFNVLASKN